MFRRGCFCVASVVVFSAVWAVAGFAGQWPQWGGGPARNMAAHEPGLPASFVPGKKRSDGSGVDMRTTCNVRWVAKLGSENYSSPVVAGGRIYIGINDANLRDPRYRATGGGLLLCLDEHSGKRLWQLVVPKLLEGKRSEDFDEMNLGICSTPAVEDNRVYVVSNRCDVLCLDALGMANGNQGPFIDERHYTVEPGQRPVEPQPGDGDILWEFDMLGKLPVFPHDAACSSPLVYGNCVYVGTANGIDGHRQRRNCPLPLAPSLIALDKYDGHLVAKDDALIGTRVFHGQWSSPSLGLVGGRPEVFFGGGDGVCYAFDAVPPAAFGTAVGTAAGAAVELPLPPGPAGYLHEVWSCDCNTPAHKFHAGKPVDYWEGDEREGRGNHNDWTYLGLNEIIGTPVFYNQRVYVAVGRDPTHGANAKGGLFCIDAAAGGVLWSYDDAGRSLSTVSIADGLLYLADAAGRIHCLDADTGKLYWVHQTHADIWSSTLVADGKVYVGTRKSLCVLAAGKEEKVLGEIRLGSQIRATPAVADGMLFVASQRYLWAVELSPLGVASGSPAGRKHARPKGS